MSYTIQKFEKEPIAIGAEMREIYVAIIKKDGEDQPFRVSVENFESKESALAEVHAWIAARVVEDEHSVAEKEREAERAQKDGVLHELNASV